MPRSKPPNIGWIDVQRKFYTLPPDPPLAFTSDESDKLKTIKTPLDTYIAGERRQVRPEYEADV